MKALTIRQPWAWVVASGLKPVENRTWPPPRSLARFAVHAASTPDSAAWQWPAMRASRGLWRPDMPAAATAAVVAVATLHSAHEAHDCPHGDDCTRWGFQGDPMWHWVISTVPLDHPVPCPGQLKVWALPLAVEARVLEQFAGSTT